MDDMAKQLSDEAWRKFTDERYPYALKEWLRGQLVSAYETRMPREEAVAIVDRVWTESGCG